MGPTASILMQRIFLGTILICCLIGCGGETKKVEDQVVAASCGLCKFGMQSSQCELAVKIDMKPYFVLGVDTGDHAKFHEPDGYCMVVRHAKVSGKIVDEKFVASSYELLPVKTESEK